MNRCIACAECINVCKDVLMIDALQFMKKGGFNQVVAKAISRWLASFAETALRSVRSGPSPISSPSISTSPGK